MKQLYILSIKPKFDMGLFVDFCVFTWIWLNLSWSEPKIVLVWCSEQFYVPISQIQSNLGKNTEINKQ